MALIYSVYEAKARFSEVIRQVREGKTVTVSYRGKPVAEIRATRTAGRETIDDRLEALERNGNLVPSARADRFLKPVGQRPGALARFLAERG